jgi:hypothetical protein
MPVRTLNFDPPAKAPLVDRERDITNTWLVYFNGVGNQLERRIVVDFETTVPLIAAGATTQATATVPGIKAGDFCLAATFEPGNAGIRVTGQVTAATTVTVTFENLTGSGITLGAGTIYLRLEQR